MLVSTCGSFMFFSYTNPLSQRKTNWLDEGRFDTEAWLRVGRVSHLEGQGVSNFIRKVTSLSNTSYELSKAYVALLPMIG